MRLEGLRDAAYDSFQPAFARLIPGLVERSRHRIADRDELGRPAPCRLLKRRDVPQPGHAARPDHRSPQRVSHLATLHLFLPLDHPGVHSLAPPAAAW